MKTPLTVVSLGPGDPRYLTRQAEAALREASCLILRTGRHRAAEWLAGEGVAFETLDDFYDRYDNFDAMHAAMAEALWARHAKRRVTFAVQDALTDGAVAALRASVPEGERLQVLPGVSTADVCLAQAGPQPAGFCVLPATSLADLLPDPAQSLLVTELDSARLAGEAKLLLASVYGDEAEMLFFPSTARRTQAPRLLPLWELDRQPAYDHTVCALLPAAGLTGRERYALPDLVRIMARLRGEGGCPWDRAQTHQSLRKYLLEEAYESAGAIDEGDPDHLAEELGDVLLQIVFHAQIGRELGEFDLSDVTSAVCRKMIRRHTHIFGAARADTAEAVSRNWERIKREERGESTQAEALRAVSAALPALTRAAKVQKRAADVHFDWDSALEALPKVAEEAEEVRAELDAGRDPQEELGDLLFACVNVVRLAGCDAEEALTAATEKFIRRFTAMESLIRADGKHLEDMTLPEMDVYWDRAKALPQT